MPKIWIKERKREYYHRRAKEENYRSRAAYKLFQSVKKYGFIKFGDVIVDLGAAPGGWLQASRLFVGSEGFVLGVDLKYIQPIEQSNVRIITGDITDPQITNRIKEILPRPPDVVVSDVSPKISGIWELDHARQIDLARRSLQIAASLLRHEGNFFVKVFQGNMLNDFLKEVNWYFRFVKLVKPKASRAKSAEIYVLGRGLKQRSVATKHQ
ncbi:MAG: RlmE family RNA methyltransferase [Candidatus Hodarchaeota archaeon]